MDNIITLAGKFKDVLELKAYCDAQYTTLETALSRVAELQAENTHLKELLSSTAPLIPPIAKIEVSSEQAICEIQIKMLQEDAMHRQLTLEETKRLDLLVKNLYIIKGQLTSIPVDSTQLPDNISEAKLLELATVTNE